MKTDLKTLAQDAEALAEMNETEFTSLHLELASLPLALDSSEDAFDLIRRRSPLDDEDVAAGDFILYALYEIANRGDKPLSQLFEKIILAVRKMQDNEDIVLIETLTQRLDKLSQLRNILTSIKASFLLAERENLLISARVISDVRPVFEDDLAAPSALIINSLRLEYQSGEDKSTIFVAIDDDDIDMLITQLERAKRKNTSLKGVLDNSKTSVIQ